MPNSNSSNGGAYGSSFGTQGDEIQPRTESDAVPSFSSPSVRKTTGRMIATLRTMSTKRAEKTINDICGVKLVGSAADLSGNDDNFDLADEEAMIMEKLGIVVMNSSPEQSARLQARSGVSSDAGISAIEEEEILYALSPNSAETDFLQGYRSGVNDLVDRMVGDGGSARGDQLGYSNGLPGVVETPALGDQFTWGLRAIGVDKSTLSGAGVRVAVLDTGFDLDHPDFAGRTVEHASFVQGECAQDGHGHGTHCIGSACGPREVSGNPGYGVAFGADIYAGKVLSNQGSGGDGGILLGIEWAIRNNCDIISMSLGGAQKKGAAYSEIYEQAALKANENGTVIVAAAGNDGNRGPDFVVSRPANCPSIYAVGAIDSNLRPASFSNRSDTLPGSGVEIAAPGVGVFSSVPMPRRYARFNGTSMATPHVAGVLALLAEAHPHIRGMALANLLWPIFSMRLEQPSTLAGAGLVQAPQ